MTKFWILLHICAILFVGIICPPVEEKAETEEEVKLGLEYERYLKEVVSILETDDAFRQKLEDSNITDIKSGAIAKHLELVSHSVRSKLDELKRQEVDRLQTIQKISKRINNDLASKGLEGVKHFDSTELLMHVNHKNPETFEEKDLEQLVKKATSDLEDIDNKRKTEFKTYEMEKEHLRREKLRQMDELSRKKAEEDHENEVKKHKEHPKVNHPGSKDQLEEVWEEDDHLDKEDFDPKTFFMLHDINTDGVLDEMEVEALFQNELDKVYDEENPEDDPMERYEDMNRMREHVFNEVDKNRDRQITLQEFLDSTQNNDFENDEEWEGLEDEEMYTDEEFEEYERQQREWMEANHAQAGEINIPPHPDQMQQHQQDNVQHMGQGQPPVQHQGQGQPPVQHQGQPPVQHQGQPPVQHQGQPPVQNQGQPPVQHQGQPPVQNQGQPPVQQPGQGQPPVQQQGQVPVAQGQPRQGGDMKFQPHDGQGQVDPNHKQQAPTLNNTEISNDAIDVNDGKNLEVDIKAEPPQDQEITRNENDDQQ